MVRIIYDYLSVDIIGLINFIFCVCPLLVWVFPRPHGLRLSKVSLVLLLSLSLLLLLFAKFRSLGSPVLDLTPSRNATLLEKRYIAERRPELDYSLTSIKRPPIKRPPSIKRPLCKVPIYFLVIYCT